MSANQVLIHKSTPHDIHSPQYYTYLDRHQGFKAVHCFHNSTQSIYLTIMRYLIMRISISYYLISICITYARDTDILDKAILADRDQVEYY